MPAPVAPASAPTPAVSPTLEFVRAVPAEILAEPGPVPGVDFVPTSCPPAEVRPSKGQDRWLRAGTERLKVRGWAVRERVIQCHVFEGKSLRETARLVGRSYKYVSSVWAAVCREVNGGKATPEERREAVRSYMDRHLRACVERAQGLMGEAAAYGAVVVQGIKALGELHGIRPEELAPAGFNLEDVGREVRVVSPLLIDRLDQVRALSGVAGDSEASRAGAAARWAKGREVPIEGVPSCPVADPATTCDNMHKPESESSATVGESGVAPVISETGTA